MEVVEIPESLTGWSVETQDTEIQDAEELQSPQFRQMLLYLSPTEPDNSEPVETRSTPCYLILGMVSCSSVWLY